MKARLLQTVVLLVICCLALALGARAQEEAPEKKESVKEQSIYIPYEKLRKVFEREGRGVFLPYERFQQLWRAAREKQPAPAVHRPPVNALITEVEALANVANDVLEVKATVKIEVLAEGWNEVPLGLGDVAITKAALGENPARLVSRGAKGYSLLVEKQGKAPELVELKIEFAKAYTKAPGRNSVSLASPMAPVSRWDVRIPEAGVKVNIHPLLAATEAPATSAAKETRVLAFVGATPTVRLEWTPKTEGAKGLEALVSVEVQQQVRIEEGVSHTHAELTYAVSRASLSELTVEVPADQKVVNVYDPNVREWSVAAAGKVQLLTAQLFEPAKKTQQLLVELQKFGQAAELDVPVVKAAGVGRQQGLVLVRAAPGLRVEAGKRQGLLQVDASKLPTKLARTKWQFSYRYAALPFELSLKVEKIQPRILVDALAEVHLQPESLTVDFLALYDVQRVGVFQFALAIPAGYEVRRVRGLAVAGAKAVDVDKHHFEAGNPGRLVVNLARQAKGRVGLDIQLHRALNEPDLRSPTGKAAGLDLAVPRADAAAVTRENGRLVVYAPESLRLNVGASEGLRAISHAEAVGQRRSTLQSGRERPVLAFAYAQEPLALALTAERRKPQITARQLLEARIESGVVKYSATFFYDILYSGVKSVRIDVPAALANRIRVTSSGIRRAVIEGDEIEDLLEGYQPWSLTGETELVGSKTIRLHWEEKIKELKVGNPVELTVPRLIPRQLDRAWGQILLAKAEAIDVVPTEARQGLRPIDPQHDLMPGASRTAAARAFEFHDDWALNVQVTRYEPKDVKATSIERGLVRMVVTRGDLTSVQALYRLRSARQRLVIQLPGNVEFDSQPLRLNGRPVSLEQGVPGEYFVPLVGQKPDDAFLLELRYTVRGGGLRLECPGFPKEPAIQQIYLSVFLPPEQAYLGSRGPWNPELIWEVSGFTMRPRARRNSQSLVHWVAEGLSADANGPLNFATDGRHLLFSTLRPPVGADGALRLAAFRDWLLKAFVLLVGLGLGLWLVPAPFQRRALVVGCMIVALVLAAVFLPSLAHAAVNNATVGGAVVVLVVWILWYILVTRPRDPVLAARAATRIAQAQAAQALARKAVADAAAAAASEPEDEPPPAEAPADAEEEGGEDRG